MPKPLGISLNKQTYMKQYHAEHKQVYSQEYKTFRYAKHKYGLTDDECTVFGEEDIKEYGKFLSIFKTLSNKSEAYKQFLIEAIHKEENV